MSFSDTAASYLAVGGGGSSVLCWVFFSFPLFFFLLLQSSICKNYMWFLSLSSEVLKLLLKLLLKKGFGQLSMEKKYILSLVKYFNVSSSKNQKPKATGVAPLSNTRGAATGACGSGGGVPVPVPPDRRGQLLIKEKQEKKRLLNFQSGGRKGS